jgi:NAD+ synthase (glutamine-hydrolysing)
MRVALAQIDPVVGDLKGNAELVIARCREAQAAGAGLVVFPELAIPGYPPEDLLLKDYFVAECARVVQRVAEAVPGIVALVGAPLWEDGRLFNAAAVMVGGRIAGWYRKILLPNYAVFDEKRYFAPGDRVLALDIDGIRVGITICEDIWDDEGPVCTVAQSGSASLVINMSMSPYHTAKGREREEMLAVRARAIGSHICYVNGVGGQDELVFDGHSVVFDAEGCLVARARQFEQQLLVVDVAVEPRPLEGSVPGKWPIEVLELPRAEAALASPTVPKDGATVSVEISPAASDASSCLIHEALSLEGEIYQALCLGVRDYTNKNRFKQVVIGISGGIDSAFTACIAADALGADRVNTVSMPSRYSSSGTRNDARETAERLGVHHYEIPIESVYQTYLKELAAYLDPAAPGVTEQNIQARIRGNLLMALSNKFGWLVLTTGNKSETAVGYATLYGDMAGGFAVLKDVPKTLVYRLCEYRNSLGPGEGPIPQSTIVRAPSAELAADQTDQDTLPPYEVLDRIIEAYVVMDDSVEEIAATGIDKATVQRVVAMIDGNEYKRRQAAPGVRITPKAFGKDRRLPITNRFRG